MEKECRECHEIKDVSEFYAHKGMKDGFLSKCKSCVKSRVAKHREQNIDNIRKYDRERGNLPHRVAARKEYQKTDSGRAAMERGRAKWLGKNPEKRAAHVILGNALRGGKV